jgi:hypothetical protein
MDSARTREREAAERIAADRFTCPTKPLVVVRFRAERLAVAADGNRRLRCEYELECSEGASCDEPSHAGSCVGPVETTDHDLYAAGCALDDAGRLTTATFDRISAHNEKLIAARALAERAHAGATRKHGPPYIEHPVRVARRLHEIGPFDVDLIAAGFLHDVVEDTSVEARAIEELCGQRVARLVVAVTRARDTSRDDYLRSVAAEPDEVITLKLADRTENLLDAPLQSDRDWTRRYVEETQRHLLPLADRVPPELKIALEGALRLALASTEAPRAPGRGADVSQFATPAELYAAYSGRVPIQAIAALDKVMNERGATLAEAWAILVAAGKIIDVEP